MWGIKAEAVIQFLCHYRHLTELLKYLFCPSFSFGWVNNVLGCSNKHVEICLVPVEGLKCYIAAFNIYKILTKWNVSVFFLIRRWRGLLSFRLWWPGRSWRSVWCRSSPLGHCKWPSVPWLIRWCAFLSLPVPPSTPYSTLQCTWPGMGSNRCSQTLRSASRPLPEEPWASGAGGDWRWENISGPMRKCQDTAQKMPPRHGR